MGLFRQAAEHFEKAAQDPAYALKGLAQMDFSLKKSGKQEEAVAAFRRALQVPSTSSKEQVQIFYLLGRTLESLDRIPEALEAYRWLHREAPQYRDVAMRIQSLSTRRMHTDNCSPWATQALRCGRDCEPALFMKVRRESAQTRGETDTRRREALRHTHVVCRRAEWRDCPSQPRIRACSRSLMNIAGQETGSNGPPNTFLVVENKQIH